MRRLLASFCATASCVAVLATGAGLTASAQDAAAVDTRAYKVGQAPVAASANPNVERPAAVNGTTWAVIAPTYNANGTTSYIRLYNGNSATAATFTVQVVGSPVTNNVYGTASISVPAYASPQYSLGAILESANAGALTGGDTSYSIYLQSLEAKAGYQHVTFNENNLFFENNSVCANLLNQSVASQAFMAVVTNVHSSFLADYPSQLEVHNYFNARTNYRIWVRNATSGALIGSVLWPMDPNASYIIPIAGAGGLEQTLAWLPTGAADAHLNIIVTAEPATQKPNVVLGQAIVNSQLNATINMSTVCAVNAVTTTGDGGGFGGGGPAY